MIQWPFEICFFRWVKSLIYFQQPFLQMTLYKLSCQSKKAQIKLFLFLLFVVSNLFYFSKKIQWWIKFQQSFQKWTILPGKYKGGRCLFSCQSTLSFSFGKEEIKSYVYKKSLIKSCLTYAQAVVNYFLYRDFPNSTIQFEIDAEKFMPKQHIW